MSTAYWLLSIGGGVIFLSIVLPAFVGGAWSPTSMARVRAMLQMAQLAPGETLYDLGAGDGRIIITAAREFGAQAVGIEIDPLRAALCRWRIRLGGLTGRARVERANFFDVDLCNADVVTFYLSQAAADRLKDKFETELRPGSRVVSHRRPVPGWRPAAVDERHGLYLYVIGESPADGT
ncbi:MAG: class I SAM-dependent methyltransferase [Limnochordales bacterium]|nr:class I SAM-dependent methyltransferase [Limnochordales bacterium]